MSTTLKQGDRVRIRTDIPNLPKAGREGTVERLTEEDALMGGVTVRFVPGKGLGKTLIFFRTELELV